MLLWRGDWTHGGPQYVALGDSFQSGEGTEYRNGGEFLPGTDETEDYLNSDGYFVERPRNQCHRSDKAYPVLLNGWIPEDMSVTLDFWACKDMYIDDLTESERDYYGPPWTDPEKPSSFVGRIDDGSMSSLDRLGDETWLVTIGIGGNDIGFAKVLSDCAAGNHWNGWATCFRPGIVDETYELISDQSEPLEELYGEIRDRADNAAVFVLGYPRFFATEEEVDACWADYEATWTIPRDWDIDYWLNLGDYYTDEGTWIHRPGDPAYLPPGADPDLDYGPDTIQAQTECRWLEDSTSGINRVEQLFINDGVEKLNDVIREAAHGVAFYVDIEDVGAGREIGSSGDSSKWFMNGAATNQAFHPNTLGHELIAKEFLRQLVEPRYGQTPLINPGEQKQYIYNVIGGSGTKLHVSGFWPGSDVVLTLTSPSGVEYTRTSVPPGSTRITRSLLEYIEVSDPEPGDWTITAYGADIAPGGESFLLDIEFEPSPNELPVGEIHMDRQGSTVTFSAPGSFDPDGTIVEYWWDLGDGTLVTAPEVTHTYASAGTYRVGLILTDDRGGEGFVFADSPVVISEPAATGSGGTDAGTGSEPEPSISGEPQPTPSSGTDIGPTPEPSPSPSVIAGESTKPGSGMGLWWMVVTLAVVFAIGLGGLWHRQRFPRG